MSLTIERSIVCALIESSDKKMLLGFRTPGSGGVYADCWQFPGGGVEDGETLEEALQRELREEIGFDTQGLYFELVDDVGYGEASKKAVDGTVQTVRMRFFIFRLNLSLQSDAIRFELPLHSEFASIRWVSRDELPSTPLVPAAEPLFRRIGYWPTC